MTDAEIVSQHCYSVRLMKPFWRYLNKIPDFPKELIAPLEKMDLDERIPIPVVLELLRGCIAITGDEDIGLKAAREIELGDYGAVEYAAASSRTLGEAIQVLARYLGLVNDALTLTLEVRGEEAVAQLQSAVTLTRAAEDFQLAAFHRANMFRNPLPEFPPFEVWFEHEEPEDTSEYAITFGSTATVRFGQPFCACVFDASYLGIELLDADPKLHALITRHAEGLLAELPKAESFTQKVRERLMKELGGGNPTVGHIAELLATSSRTLMRRLEDEGTSFKELLDDLRRRLALRYVGASDLELSEIAFLLGFSQSAAFHRAFKRWSDQTPGEYRRSKRG